MGLREEQEKFHDQTPYLSLMNFPGAPFSNQPPPPPPGAPARKPPETGLRAEREKFYDQTPPPAAPAQKPPETGLRAEWEKFYDQAPYLSLMAKYPGSPRFGSIPASSRTWSTAYGRLLGLPLGLPLNVLNLFAPLKLIGVGIPPKLDPPLVCLTAQSSCYVARECYA